MSEESRTKTAYHECGHALTAFLLGGRIERLTVEFDVMDEPHGKFGETGVIWPESWSEREVAIGEIKVSLSGPVVEMIYDETRIDPEFLEEWRDDWQLAVDRAETYLPGDQPTPQRLARFVNDLLSFFERDDVWAAVAALADELEAHGTLEEEDIDDVLRAWPIR